MKVVKRGWISTRVVDGSVAGAFRTDEPPSGDGYPATLSYDIPEKSKTKTVWQWRYLNNYGNWLITRRLYTENEANIQFGGSTPFEKHAGPFEVPL